ncbi:MAG TPA: hypothetical protein VIL69_16560 [Roseomonas sp.]
MPSARREGPAAGPLAGRALLHVTCETLALGCLFERRGGTYIRVPVHRRQQMMGCEWHCRRAGGALRGVSYTFEALEDWIALAREAPERIAALYRSILGRPDISAEDLAWRSDVFTRDSDGYVLAFPAGSYNPLNAWNTVRGAVHLNGCAEAGFEGKPRARAGEGRLGLAGAAPERGLLFLGGSDRTADVLCASRREGPAGPVRRLEVSVPEEADWSLSDLTLPDGERFTPLGLFQALLGGAPTDNPRNGGDGWDDGPSDPLYQSARPGAGSFLPGRLVTDALLRQACLTSMGCALA